MSSQVVFTVIVLFLCVDFIVERGLEWLNMRAMSPCLPENLQGIYGVEEYGCFQRYKKEIHRLDWVSSVFSFAVMMAFLCLGGFGWYNRWVVSITENAIGQTLLFMVGMSLAVSVLELPFDGYTTFRIEEKYGFNRSSVRLWLMDTVKRILLSWISLGVLLVAVVGFYLWAGSWFWLYAWGIVSLLSVFLSLFYSRLIVPLFNRQVPLEAGSLRDKIEDFARKAGFRLKDIYVIDASKRSTKANAYFTGFGPQKRIVLYDTLLKDLTEEEIVAVLAHETGHYRKRHNLQFIGLSVVQTGLMLWLFSLLVNESALSVALGGEQVYFQLGLIAFMILYTPVSMVLGLFMHAWSRRNEYEADAYAAQQGLAPFLISGLKKISVKTLSNLTPHPWYEFVYYSHPSLLRRIEAFRQAE